MEFQKAFVSLKNSKKITRKSWGDRDIFLCLYRGMLMIHADDKQYHPCLISELDMFADDWDPITDA